LNFFTSPSVPTSSVLLYPNYYNGYTQTPGEQYTTGSYALAKAFSFDFYINPRYNVDSSDGSEFKAGTIFHLSSSYCLSLVTGSKKDINGLPASFRLQLQLSHSADITPSRAIPGSYPNNLVFLSNDNSLDWNKWHRVVVTWGTNYTNQGTGSFNIDGIDQGHFVMPSGSVCPKFFANSNNPGALCIGNYYEGTNSDSSSQRYFFSDVSAKKYGTLQLIDSSGSIGQPDKYYFRHPLKAEVHDLIILRYFMTQAEINATAGLGLFLTTPNNLAFYLPSLFVEDTPVRRGTSPSDIGVGAGGILRSPLGEHVDGSTDSPFNVLVANNVEGHYINLENFVKDFSNLSFPLMHHLSRSISYAALPSNSNFLSANEILYSDPQIKKRNLTILPCDDGNFRPNYDLMDSYWARGYAAGSNGKKQVHGPQYSERPHTKFRDSHGRINFSVINLSNLISSSMIYPQVDVSTLQNLTDLQQDNFGYSPFSSLCQSSNNSATTFYDNKISQAIDDGTYDTSFIADADFRNYPTFTYQITQDPSSSQVMIFNISNLYYGSSIVPGTFQLKDNNLLGSAGTISITLKDDGFGSLYRADTLSTPCKWNCVGNIFYNEGIVVIKSPHLYFFGSNGYEMSFKGEYQLHSSKYEVLAPPGLLNSSSNPSYMIASSTTGSNGEVIPLKASGDPLDTSSFVYVSNVNFHDENLNVVAKATFAQPFLKREGDKILVKIAFDF
jgi:hypothetical protein